MCRSTSRISASGQAFELLANKVTVLGPVTSEDYPLQKKRHSLEFLREIGHLRPRTNTFSAMFRVRNCLSYLVHKFFQERGFIWAHTPILTATDAEGAGEMFQVTTLDLERLEKNKAGKVDYQKDFFGKPTHLTVSGQLQAEFLALSMGNVYTFGPTFRAENSNTSRHLSEFWMIEPEMAFAELSDDMDLAEQFLQYLLKGVLDQCEDEILFFEKFYKNVSLNELKILAEKKFQRLSYSDAIHQLKQTKRKFEHKVEWGIDLQTEHERFLSEEICKGPVTIYDYPKDIKAFYMRLNDDERTVAAMDLLIPKIGELIGGSQREERLAQLQTRMREMNVPEENLQWYSDLRRFGSVPHAGFGLGFERLLMYVTGIQNIRDVIMCPRTPMNISF